jgi:predicted Fe-S protein YdhL (DUF1289 family)
MFSAEIKPPIMISSSNGGEPAIASPCISVCVMARSGYCLGCARTLAEIGSWGYLSPASRLAVMEELPARKAGVKSDSRP